MFDYFLLAFSPLNVLLALGGVAAGTIIGSIPGLTATMAVAVLVPITFSMEPASALILLGAIYTGAIYGGAYAAILLNTPGTPSAIATTFDGYPMARRGDGDLAVTIACLSSLVGGLVGALALLLLAPPLAEAALAFGPVEYFWLAIFGLSLIAALSTQDLLKGLIGAAFGLLLSTVGVSETSAAVRFTFGSQMLVGGIEIVSALIGLYCIPVLMNLVATPDRHLKEATSTRGFRLPEAVTVLLRNKFNVLRSSVIGTVVGALPGAGGSIAGLVAYSSARRGGRGEVPYGEGNPGGVIATESANNATVGGGFIPTLVLGIPGTPPDAVILGALLVQGVRTGPALFTQGSDIVYTFVFGLFLATVLMLPVGLLIGRFAYGAIVRAPKSALVPVVAFMTVIGAFAIRNSLSDVMIMVVLGVVGWLAERRGFAVSPIVLGLILGKIAEQGFVQSWTIGAAVGDLPAQFFGRPLSQAIIGFTLLAVLYPLLPEVWQRLRGSRGEGAADAEAGASTAVASDDTGPAVASEHGGVRARTLDAIGFVVFAGLALTALVLSWRLNADAAVFPRTVAIAMGLLALAGIVRVLLRGTALAASDNAGLLRAAAVPVVMLLTVWLIPTLGFGLAGVVMGTVLMVIAQHGRPSLPMLLGTLAGVAAVVVAFTYAFRVLLAVPLPGGAYF